MATSKWRRTAKLTLMEHTTSGGIRERDCTLDPTDGWLLVANPDSNNIAVMKRDQNDRPPIADGDDQRHHWIRRCALIFPERPNVAL